ncbi:MAG TPA: prenyltransferase/squalene oxidase repeat-containing protein [Planctomycetota bacterium]|nr:prenyltransferase/squalene oxidase repeat-containing protein [Planctomycetota bacterium]
MIVMKQKLDDMLDQEEELEQEEAQKEAGWQWLANTPCWAVAAVLHLLLLLVFMNIIYEKTKPEETGGGFVFQIAPKEAPPPPPAYDPTLKRDIKKTRKLPGPKDLTDKPILLQKEVYEVATEMPLGKSLDNLSNLNTDFSDSGLTGINMSMGIGAGVAGAYGERSKKDGLQKEGGSPETQDVVWAALEWLKRHQSPDGSWQGENFTAMCEKTCRNEDEKRYGNGKGFADHDVGLTALAMLAFSGYGYTHGDGENPEYVECLQNAVAYLKKSQVHSEDPTMNGRFGPGTGEQWAYDHAIATMAMGELLVMSNDVGLKKPVTDAVKLCLRAQNDGFGWRYGVKAGDNDTSVTGWMVLALKTAKGAGLDIPKTEFERAFAGAMHWLDRATSKNGKTGYMVPGDEGSRLASIQGDPYPYSKNLSCMTAVAVLCRLFAGESRGKKSIQQGIDILMHEPPRWQEQKGRSLSTINMYYWYYASYAIFQYGGPAWKKWNPDMIKALLESQRQGKSSCEDGSWDPIDEWGTAGGRVYATALGAMTLEVYYRFTRAQPIGVEGTAREARKVSQGEARAERPHAEELPELAELHKESALVEQQIAKATKLARGDQP